jgi:alanine dehydrogenase
VRPAKVVIIGAGIAGTSACQVAVGVGARVSILDVDPARLRYVRDILGAHLTTVMSNRANIEEEVGAADLVIGAVLIPGAKAPRLVERDDLKRMKPGSVIIDVAIDQGGCIATSRPTSHSSPTYIVDDVVHYCVTNMPGAVGRTSTFALCNVTLPWVIEIAQRGVEQAARDLRPIATAVNMCAGEVTNKAVAETFGLPLSDRFAV